MERPSLKRSVCKVLENVGFEHSVGQGGAEEFEVKWSVPAPCPK